MQMTNSRCQSEADGTWTSVVVFTETRTKGGDTLHVYERPHGTYEDAMRYLATIPASMEVGDATSLQPDA